VLKKHAAHLTGGPLPDHDQRRCELQHIEVLLKLLGVPHPAVPFFEPLTITSIGVDLLNEAAADCLGGVTHRRSPVEGRGVLVGICGSVTVDLDYTSGPDIAAELICCDSFFKATQLFVCGGTINKHLMHHVPRHAAVVVDDYIHGHVAAPLKETRGTWLITMSP
jgi:hypothetical protein